MGDTWRSLWKRLEPTNDALLCICRQGLGVHKMWGWFVGGGFVLFIVPFFCSIVSFHFVLLRLRNEGSPLDLIVRQTCIHPPPPSLSRTVYLLDHLRQLCSDNGNRRVQVCIRRTITTPLKPAQINIRGFIHNPLNNGRPNQGTLGPGEVAKSSLEFLDYGTPVWERRGGTVRSIGFGFCCFYAMLLLGVGQDG